MEVVVAVDDDSKAKDLATASAAAGVPVDPVGPDIPPGTLAPPAGTPASTARGDEPSPATPAGQPSGTPATKLGAAAAAAAMLPPSPMTWEQVHKRMESLQQQNRVLKCELDTYKLRVKSLQEENKALRQASVHIQAKAEQEEEFISNTLLKKIQALKKEKENLALNYEQEEECLTNDLSRKLDQLRQEKVQLEHTLEQEQECLVNRLMRRIEKLETETSSKQRSLETLRREKVELENTLEQEQEALVNKLWKKMDQLETEKRSLQMRLDKPISEPDSPKSLSDYDRGGDTAANLANNIRALKQECARLKHQLIAGKQEHEKKMAAYAREEREIREENLRLQRRLQLELERREALCRHLSESESSLEMEEERVYNELSHHNGGVIGLPTTATAAAAVCHRTRTASSPVPSAIGLVGLPPQVGPGGPFGYSALSAGGAVGPGGVVSAVVPPLPSTSRPISPGLNYGDRWEKDCAMVAAAGALGTGRIPISMTTPPGIQSPPSPVTGASHVMSGCFVKPPPAFSTPQVLPLVSPPPSAMLHHHHHQPHHPSLHLQPSAPLTVMTAAAVAAAASSSSSSSSSTSSSSPSCSSSSSLAGVAVTTAQDNKLPLASPMDTNDNSSASASDCSLSASNLANNEGRSDSRGPLMHQ